MAQAVQSVRFSQTESPSSVNGGRGWTPRAAQAWLRAHNFKTVKKDSTSGQHRYRQFEPSLCIEGSYKTLTENLPRGIQLVSCDKK